MTTTNLVDEIWEEFFDDVLKESIEDADGGYGRAEDNLAQAEIDDWENREQYGIEW